jgi:predicted RNA-binding protein with PUA-like domain
MAYWLIKSEPEVFSWADLEKSGAKGEPWTGVRNHQAKQHLNAMRKGDRCLYYHSNTERAAVGVAEVVKESYPDPTDATAKFVCVDVKAVEPLKTPVTLTAAKAEPKLAEMVLVKNSRLSVQPVTPAEWAIVMKMSAKS